MPPRRAEAVDAGLQAVEIICPVLRHVRGHVEAHDEGAVAASLDDLQEKLGGGLLLELKAGADGGAGVDDDANAQGRLICWWKELTFSGAFWSSSRAKSLWRRLGM